VHMLIQTKSAEGHHDPCGEVDGCAGVGVFSRLRYFHGQPLGALDLRQEQAYHLQKDRLRNRLLHGWGIVCGLDVRVSTEAYCRSEDKDPASTEVVVLRGAAIDCAGNEIVVRQPRPVPLSTLLSADDLQRLHKQPATVYLTLCYREVLADPMRPLLAGGCEPAPSCEYGRVVETYQICASTTAPDPGPACEPCCGACGDPCLELVAIIGFDPAQPVQDDQLDFSGRRRLARHTYPQITEINWVHGATYSLADANGLLDTGLEVWLSRPVHAASLRPGVVELTWLDLGGGRRGGIYNIEGTFVDLPQTGLVDHFKYKRMTGETLQPADRVVITVRGDFILDECCHALDGNHVGGSVPVSAAATYQPLRTSDAICEPRPSGDGIEGGDFTSWIYVAEKEYKP
jgi:hypothetical protein